MEEKYGTWSRAALLPAKGALETLNKPCWRVLLQLPSSCFVVQVVNIQRMFCLEICRASST